jgi:hypothetical protein
MPRCSNIQSYFFLTDIRLTFGTFLQPSMLSTCRVLPIVINSVIIKIFDVEYYVRKAPKMTVSCILLLVSDPY